MSKSTKTVRTVLPSDVVAELTELSEAMTLSLHAVARLAVIRGVAELQDALLERDDNPFSLAMAMASVTKNLEEPTKMGLGLPERVVETLGELSDKVAEAPALGPWLFLLGTRPKPPLSGMAFLAVLAGKDLLKSEYGCE